MHWFFDIRFYKTLARLKTQRKKQWDANLHINLKKPLFTYAEAIICEPTARF